MNPTKLPQAPGFYLWYVLDISYLDVGCVQVLKDRSEHLAWLKEQLAKSPVTARTAFVYTNAAGEELSMYHQAVDHLPVVSDTGEPFVDGYLPFDLEMIRHDAHQNNRPTFKQLLQDDEVVDLVRKALKRRGRANHLHQTDALVDVVYELSELLLRKGCEVEEYT